MWVSQRGSVIVAELPAPKGRNHKGRPAVVVTEDRDIPVSGPISVVAVTSSIDDPIPATQVELPWDRTGAARSGLKKRSVALCDWVVVIERSEIERVIGQLPNPVTAQIMSRLPPEE